MDETYQRYRYSVLIDRVRGEVIVVDLFRDRLAKMRRRIFAWADAADKVKAVSGARTIMVTLTYRGVDDYAPGHIGSYLKTVKGSLGKKLIGWAWVAEIQSRGAVHYHLLLLVTKDAKIKTPDESGQWPWGMSRVETARTAYYLGVYAGKGDQKDLSRFPKGLRLYGISLRGFSKDLRELYRKRSGIADEKVRSSWEWMGSAATEGYATEVLQKRAETVVK